MTNVICEREGQSGSDTACALINCVVPVFAVAQNLNFASSYTHVKRCFRPSSHGKTSALVDDPVYGALEVVVASSISQNEFRVV